MHNYYFVVITQLDGYRKHHHYSTITLQCSITSLHFTSQIKNEHVQA